MFNKIFFYLSLKVMLGFFICTYLISTTTPNISAAEPNWIWTSITAKQKEPKGGCRFRKQIDLKKIKSAKIQICADDNYQLIINSRLVGTGNNWVQMDQYDITKILREGKNMIVVRALNSFGNAAMVARIEVTDDSGKKTEYLTDASWKSQPIVSGSWKEASGKSAQWLPSHVYGQIGKTNPWGNRVTLAKNIKVVKELKTIKRPKGKFRLVDGDRVILLGSTMIEREGSYGYLETALTTAFAKRNIIFVGGTGTGLCVSWLWLDKDEWYLAMTP